MYCWNSHKRGLTFLAKTFRHKERKISIKVYVVKVKCLLLKLNRKLRKMFLSPRRESNPQLSVLRWDALTIELLGLRWQREGYDVYWFVRATYVLMIQQSRYMSVYLINRHMWNELLTFFLSLRLSLRTCKSLLAVFNLCHVSFWRSAFARNTVQYTNVLTFSSCVSTLPTRSIPHFCSIVDSIGSSKMSPHDYKVIQREEDTRRAPHTQAGN